MTVQHSGFGGYPFTQIYREIEKKAQQKYMQNVWFGKQRSMNPLKIVHKNMKFDKKMSKNKVEAQEAEDKMAVLAKEFSSYRRHLSWHSIQEKRENKTMQIYVRLAELEYVIFLHDFTAERLQCPHTCPWIFRDERRLK